MCQYAALQRLQKPNDLVRGEKGVGRRMLENLAVQSF